MVRREDEAGVADPVPSGPGRAAPGAGDEADWTAQAADTVERVVGRIRDKTSMPLTTVARALVYGVMAGIMGLTVMVLLSVGLVRAVDVVTGDGNVWIAHLIVGGIFVVAGGLLLRKATASMSR